MTSRAAGWPPDAPTPPQLKELFVQITDGKVTKDRLQSFLRPKSPSPHPDLALSIRELGLNIQCETLLRGADIETVGELIVMSQQELKQKFPHLARYNTMHILMALHRHGFMLRDFEMPLDMPTELLFEGSEIPLSVRVYNCLIRVGLETIRDVTARSESDLLGIPNFGEGSAVHLRGLLARQGLALRGEKPPAPESEPQANQPPNDLVKRVFELTRLVNHKAGLVWQFQDESDIPHSRPQIEREYMATCDEIDALESELCLELRVPVELAIDVFDPDDVGGG